MPSPLEVVAVRAGIRDALNDLMTGMTEDEVNVRLRALGESGGKTALRAVVAMTLNGMVALRDAKPGAQFGGIAGFMQQNGDRFGEPFASMNRQVLEVVRHAAAKDRLRERAALEECWERWGAEAVVAVSLLVMLYDQVARARGVPMDQAWAEAAARDEREMDAQLATPLVAAEQALWEAGFTEEDIEQLGDRIRIAHLGANESGHESVSLADLADTPEKQSALMAYVDALRDALGGGPHAGDAT